MIAIGCITTPTNRSVERTACLLLFSLPLDCSIPALIQSLLAFTLKWSAPWRELGGVKGEHWESNFTTNHCKHLLPSGVHEYEYE